MNSTLHNVDAQVDQQKKKIRNLCNDVYLTERIFEMKNLPTKTNQRRCRQKVAKSLLDCEGIQQSTSRVTKRKFSLKIKEENDDSQIEETNILVKKKGPKLISFKRKKGSSRFKGVLFVKSQSKWRAQMCLGGKKKYIGSYDTEIEAALARDQKVRELFGDCKEMLNFPDKPHCVPCFRAQNFRQGYQQQPNSFIWNNSISPKHIVTQNDKGNFLFPVPVGVGQPGYPDTQMNRFYGSNYENWTMDPYNNYFFFEDERETPRRNIKQNKGHSFSEVFE